MCSSLSLFCFDLTLVWWQHWLHRKSLEIWSSFLLFSLWRIGVNFETLGRIQQIIHQVYSFKSIILKTLIVHFHIANKQGHMVQLPGVIRENALCKTDALSETQSCQTYTSSVVASASETWSVFPFSSSCPYITVFSGVMDSCINHSNLGVTAQSTSWFQSVSSENKLYHKHSHE